MCCRKMNISPARVVISSSGAGSVGDFIIVVVSTDGMTARWDDRMRVI